MHCLANAFGNPVTLKVGDRVEIRLSDGTVKFDSFSGGVCTFKSRLNTMPHGPIKITETWPLLRQPDAKGIDPIAFMEMLCSIIQLDYRIFGQKDQCAIMVFELLEAT